MAVDLSKLSPNDRDIYSVAQAMTDSWGLGALGNEIIKFIQQGYDTTPELTYMLSQTDAYKKRFAANDIRIKKGLSALNPADYLALERQYKNIVQQYGLPANFADTDHMIQLIGADISPNELDKRAQMAFKYTQNIDPNARAEWRNLFGVDDGHLAGYFLDPDRAEASLQRQANAVDFGWAAKNTGLNVDQADALKWADRGVTQQQAQTGFQNIGGFLDQEQNLGNRYGTNYTQSDAEEETFGGLASAKRKRDNLNQMEQAQFAGSGAFERIGGADQLGAY